MQNKVTVNGHETLTEQFFGVLVLAVLAGWLLQVILHCCVNLWEVIRYWMYLIIQNYPKIPTLQPKKHNQTSLEPFLFPSGLNSRQTHQV